MVQLKLRTFGIRDTEIVLNRIAIAAKQAVRDVVNESAVNIQREARRRCPVDEGRLRSAIRPEFYRGGLAADIGPWDIEYAIYVEFGTRPHVPPWRPLYRWALRKAKGDRRRAGAIAGRARAAISKYGQQPQPFLFPAWEQERPKYLEGISKAVVGAVRRHAK